jgi:ribosomal protein S18 acetylase RimI-like enzyme
MADWYHGSPLELAVLRAGSTITRDRHLAEVFSHKPEIVSIEDDGSIKHSGTQAGWLYVVDESVSPDDVYPHPRTTMPAEWEWLTRRDLGLRRIGRVEIVPSEVLAPEDVAALRWKAAPGYILRPFAPGDQPAARRLIQEGLGEHFGFIDETLNPDIDDIAANYLRRGHAFLVAEDRAGLIGTGALMFLDAQTAQMVRVSVSRAWRRRGVGRAIVAALVEIARQRGVRRIQVETNNDWDDAIGLYRRHGFAEYARDDESVYMALDL